MEAVTFDSIEVDRCTSCRGLYFDGLEAEKLRKIPGSEALDVGSVDVGRAQNANDRIRCPRDTTPMIRIVDPKQPHLWLETCSVCQGTFFDAGEFRDWKEETFADLVKSFFAKARA
jgi:Zn-finger nucleic acid-binding protein